MRKTALLFKALLTREAIFFKRYIFNTIGGIAIVFFVFLLLFWGFTGLIGSSPFYGDNLESLLLGYILWILTVMIFQDITNTLQREIKEGTIEQLYTSIHDSGFILTLNILAKILVNLITVAVIVTLLIITTGRRISFTLSTLPVIFFTLSGVLGIGFSLGGLTLLFKRIDFYLQMTQFLLVLLIAAPVNSLPILKFLPVALGSSLLREIVVKGKNLANISPGNIITLIIVGLVYLFFGYILFKLCERKAIRQGTLGHF